MKHFLRIIFTLICFIISCLPVSTAQAGLIGQKQESEMGKAAAEQLEARYGLYQDSATEERINRIGQSLAAVCGRKDINYTFKVLNTEEINALACPGGYIYVFKGLLDYIPSDAELAGVLGHEIGHVVKRHTVKQIEKNMWTQLAAILAGIASGNGDVLAMGMVVSDALAAGYSRADETQADQEGFTYTVRAGYSPYAMLVTLNKLEELSRQYGNPGWGLFDSHPEPEQRVKKIKKMLESLNISPEPDIRADGSVTVKETFSGTDWEFKILGPGSGNKPEYRAELLAGALYQVKQKGKVMPSHFIVYDAGDKATIYYEDMQILTVYQEESAAFNGTGAYANYCAALFRDWAERVNKAHSF